MPKPYTDTEERDALLEGAEALRLLAGLLKYSEGGLAKRRDELIAAADVLDEMVRCYA